MAFAFLPAGHAAPENAGLLLTGFAYDDMLEPSEGFIAVKLNDKWGFIDNTGKLRINAVYPAVCNFRGGLAAVMDENGLWGFIDTRGNRVCEARYQNPFLKGLQPGAFDPGWGFKEGLCAATENESGRSGYIDEAFNLVISGDYDYMTSFSEGCAAVGKTSSKGQILFGYIDLHGNRISEPVFYSLNAFSGGVCVVSTEKGMGVINQSGSFVVRDEWERIYNKAGVLSMKKTTPDGVVCAVADSSGRQFTDPKWQDIGECSEGLIPVKTDGKWGYIKGSGKVVIDPAFDEAGLFASGYAYAKQDGKSKFIGRAGNTSGYAEFVHSPAFSGQTAVIKDGEGVRILYLDGQRSEKFSQASSVKDGLSVVKNGAKYALFYDGISKRENPLYRGASDWAAAELGLAEEYGLLAPLGYSPDYSGLITREEFCELAVEFYTLLGGEFDPVIVNPFKDTNSIAVIRAFGAGIIMGRTESSFDPDASVTREDICVMLSRLCDALDFRLAAKAGVTFTDEAEISPWASGAVRLMSSAGVVSGYSAGTFRPSGYATVEQVAIMLLRLSAADGSLGS